MQTIYRYTTLTTYFGLLFVLLLSIALTGPATVASKLVLGIFYVSGLLLVLTGLMKDKKRSYIWYCFILLFYFVGFVQALFMPSDVLKQTLEWITLGFIVIGFIASMLAARFKQ